MHSKGFLILLFSSTHGSAVKPSHRKDEKKTDVLKSGVEETHERKGPSFGSPAALLQLKCRGDAALGWCRMRVAGVCKVIRSQQKRGGGRDLKKSGEKEASSQLPTYKVAVSMLESV